jgi:hypothetical protein
MARGPEPGDLPALRAYGYHPEAVVQVEQELWVARTSSSSRDQAIFVDHTTGASLPSDAVLLKIDRFG